LVDSLKTLFENDIISPPLFHLAFYHPNLDIASCYAYFDISEVLRFSTIAVMITELIINKNVFAGVFMAGVQFKEGDIIYASGAPMEHISLIGEGEIEGSFVGHKMLFGKTDVLGLCDITSDVHTHTYTAISDGTLYQYQCNDINSLDSLMQSNADIAYMMIGSMCRHTAELLQYKAKLKHETDGAYKMIHELYDEYSRLSKMYASTPKKLPGLDEITEFSGNDPTEDWVHNYYSEINDLKPGAHKNFFHGNFGIKTGFIRMCLEDITQILAACNMYHEYLEGISALLLHDGGYDLFSLISELHLGSLRISGADEAIDALMAPLTEELSDMTGIDSDYCQNRLDAYWDALEDKRSSQDEVSAAPAQQGVNQNLLDSLKTILDYSGCDEETAGSFTSNIHTYTDLED